MTKILLVDDMANFLDLEVSFLNRVDCKTLIAKNGMEAIKLAKSEKPDIILLDLEMPVMNGIECCRILKNDPQMKKIPVVMVTSSDRMEEAYKAGCDDFVKKPINQGHFLEEIRKFIDVKERTDSRVPLSVEVSYSKGDESFFAYSRDISMGGLFLITRDLFNIGEEVDMSFRLNDAIINSRAKVVRQTTEESGGRQVTGMGMEFEGLDDESVEIIRNYILNQA